MAQERFVELPEVGKPLPRVTAILDVLMKWALQPWAAKITAEYYKRHLEKLSGVLKDGLMSIDEFLEIDMDNIYKLAKSEHKRISKEASWIGSRVHTAINRYIQALKSGTEEISIDKDIEKPFGAFLKWWDDNEIEIIASEERVWSEDGGGYTGQFDIACYKGKKRFVYIIDAKASNGFYEPEYPLQLAAYRNAFIQKYEIEVDGMGILRLDKESGDPFWKEYENYEPYRDAFVRLTEYFHLIEFIKRLKN